MSTKALLGGKLMFPSDYLSAVEFRGKDVTLTIKRVMVDDLRIRGGKKERKPVLEFERTKKKLVLNKTNASAIADMHGPEAEKWVGKQVTFYPTRTTCGRETVDCIRVRENRQRPADEQVPFTEPEPHEEEDEKDEVFGNLSDPQPQQEQQDPPVEEPAEAPNEWESFYETHWQAAEAINPDKAHFDKAMEAALLKVRKKGMPEKTTADDRKKIADDFKAKSGPWAYLNGGGER